MATPLKTIGGSRVVQQAKCRVCGGPDCYQGVDAEFMHACRNRVSPIGFEITEAGVRFFVHWRGADNGRKGLTPISAIIKDILINAAECPACDIPDCELSVDGVHVICRNRYAPGAITIVNGKGHNRYIYNRGGDFDEYTMPIGLPLPNGRN